MSWIQDNKFLVTLAGGTIVGAIALFIAGSKANSRYEAAQEEFNAAMGDVGSFERHPLYPTRENRDGKQKAINDYHESVESLQEAFAKFRPDELKNTSPQEFTSRLLAINAEVQKAFEDSQTEAPDAFFSGFENYRTTLARGDATGILSYQLEGIRELMLALSEAGVSELRNFHRPVLPEEDGRDPDLSESSVARPLPIEITFKAPEKAVRSFLSAFQGSEQRFFVIRSIRIMNSKQVPPRTSDVKFEESAVEEPTAAGGGTGAAFSFDLPTGEEETEEAEAPPAAEPAPSRSNSNRILAQVVGTEELQVFLRIDLMQFLPAKTLP